MLDHDECFGLRNITSIIMRVVVVLSIAHHRPSLSCFASLDALVPSVLEFGVTSSPTVSKPRTATTATAKFAGILYGTACGA